MIIFTAQSERAMGLMPAREDLTLVHLGSIRFGDL